MRYLPESAIADVPKIVAGLRAGRSYAAIPAPSPPAIRKGRNGAFHDQRLEGASHHAIVPNVNTIGELKEVWPRLSPDEKKLFDAIARSYLASAMPGYRYRQTTATLARFAHHRTCRRPLKASEGGTGGFEAAGGVPARPGPPESGATEPGSADSGRGSRWMAGAGQTAPVAPVAARTAGGGWTVAGGVSRALRVPAARAGRRARARTAPAAGSLTGRRSRPCGR